MAETIATVDGIPCIGKVLEEEGDRTTWRGWAKPVEDDTRLAQLQELRKEARYEGPLQSDDGEVVRVAGSVLITGRHGKAFRLEGVGVPMESSR